MAKVSSTPKKVKTSYVIKKTNMVLAKALAKHLGITQSEVIDCLLDMARDDIRYALFDRMAENLETKAKKLRRIGKNRLKEE